MQTVAVEERIHRLEEEVHLLREAMEKESVVILEVSDKAAEDMIMSYISDKKILGISRFDDFELIEKLKLPIEQIDRILDRLEKKGVVVERTKDIPDPSG